jgi:GT2 family glycosyltransferase
MQSSKNEKNIILSFILLNYNNVDYTIPCIYSIERTVTVPFEIIIVDNASTDDSIEKLSQIEEIKLVKNKTNRGFCAGNNDGARIAEGRYIVILNNDTLVNNSNINKLPDILSQHGKFDVIGGKVVGMDGKIQSSGGYEPSMLDLFMQFAVLYYKYINFPWVRKVDWTNDDIKEVDWASGCFFTMRLDSYLELDGFDEKIFIYIDEVELHKRARKRGGRVYIYPDIVIQHYGHISWGSNHHIGLKHNYNSATYFLGKYHSLFHKFMFIASVKIVNLIYLPIFYLLHVLTLGRKEKINKKLKFCYTILTA